MTGHTEAVVLATPHTLASGLPARGARGGQRNGCPGPAPTSGPTGVGRIMRTYRSFAQLTPREREVALLVADGLKNMLIARRLGIAPGTVNTYVQQIKGRLQLAGRSEIAAWIVADRTPSLLGSANVASERTSGPESDSNAHARAFRA
jgi:DNA-binding CsgD family transcriptional regulator